MDASKTPRDASPQGSVVPGGAVRDRRIPPAGVIPRQLQMWLMVGIAALILGIILVTGHPEAPQGSPAAGRPVEPALTPSERVRTFQQQLADDEARMRLLAERADAAAAAPAEPTSARAFAPSPAFAERRQVEQQSLFADNVAFTLRDTASPAVGHSGAAAALAPPGPDGLTMADVAQLERDLATLLGAAGQRPSAPMTDDMVPAAGSQPAPTPSAAAAVPPPVADRSGQLQLEPGPSRREYPASGKRLRLLEGTVLEAVLLNRLDGTFAGPVACLVTTPVYSRDRQQLVVPAGARLLGRAEPVQAWGDSRLAVSFHRLVMPDGHTYSLELFQGLTQAGETGLRDQVDRHYWQLFGASLAIGGLSGLAQFNTRSGLDASFADSYRQAAGGSLATSTGRVLDRYLNVLPTVTIREGYRIKVYLTGDLELPAYSNDGGTR